MKKIIYAAISVFFMMNIASAKENFTPFFEIKTLTIDFTFVEKIKRIAFKENTIVKLFKKNKVKPLPNRGLLELKPKWLPKKSISKKGEKTFYYWEF